MFNLHFYTESTEFPVVQAEIVPRIGEKITIDDEADYSCYNLWVLDVHYTYTMVSDHIGIDHAMSFNNVRIRLGYKSENF
jgi:hypothetical protein